MQHRARVVMAGVAVVVAVGLLRFGLVDRQGADGLGMEPTGSQAPTRPMLAPDGGDPDADSLRAWLQQEMGEPKSLKPDRVLEILEDLDEDRTDRTKVVLFPSGRSIPKADLRARAPGWEDARLWPASRGLDEAPAMLDLHNLRAAEPGLADLQRGRDFGEVEATGRSLAGLKQDEASLEPPDPLKGDVARSLFYMAVRYDGGGGGPDLRLVAGASAAGEPVLGRVCTLLRWNEADPVDRTEQRRNDWATRRQGSRNLFVDRPEFARVLWGKECR
jgi:endonuclease I